MVFKYATSQERKLFDFALRANSRLRVICSLTRQPEAESPLAKMIGQVPNRVRLLTGLSGELLPLGHASFTDVLEQHLTGGGGAARVVGAMSAKILLVLVLAAKAALRPRDRSSRGKNDDHPSAAGSTKDAQPGEIPRFCAGVAFEMSRRACSDCLVNLCKNNS
jgi:hypothetical protein